MFVQRDNRPDRQSRNRLGQGGQAAVEMTLSLGLLLLLLLAALDFGRAFFGYVALVNAAREGARAAIVMGSPAAVEPAILQEIQGNGLNPGMLSVQTAWGGSGQPLVVTATYHFDLIVTTILPFSDLDLVASATMMIP